MNKSKILEGTLGNLVVALTEETRRFVRNKRESHQFSSDVLCNLLALPPRSVRAIDD
jgi:hypothetical protein